MVRGRRPPGIRLVGVDRAVHGELGSYVWAGRAVDSLLKAPAELVSVAIGTPLQFEGQGGVPDEASVSVFHRANLGQSSIGPVIQDQLDPNELVWTANVDAGAYVLGLFQVWEGRGDAIHYFAIEVFPPDRE